MTSSYPTPLPALIPMVRALATETGKKPSVRAVMDKFNVGAKKAGAALAALNTANPDHVGHTSPGTDDNAPGDTNERRLHAVPALTADGVAASSATNAEVPEPIKPDVPRENAAHASAMPNTPPGTPILPVQHDVPGQSAGTAADQVSTVVDTPAPAMPDADRARWSRRRAQVRRWPVALIALGAFVSIWGGWVELGKLTGFGEITPLPGIADNWTINSAITLPLGMEAYAALAFQVWLSGRTRSGKARSFAKWSALGALVLGAGGQVAYHLMKAAGMTTAPWQITTVVSCLPVIVLGFGAALVHLMSDDDGPDDGRQEVKS